ncbi:MAG: type II secretion system F family protein [Proteobacteria bacterium]|nr:type II secretion system F family protein [Pseudomonadota bacterium]
MTVFSYKARDQRGNAISGTVESSTMELAGAHLDSLGYIPIAVKEQPTSPLLKIADFFVRSIPPEDIIFFTFQISTLIGAGVPLLESLKTIAQQMKNEQFNKILEQACRDIEGGSSLSESLAKHPKLLPEVYVHMIRAGEAAGKLEEIFSHIAVMAEHEAETREKIKTAVRYPKMVFGALGLAFLIVTVFVVPQFVKIFSLFKVALPLPTRMLIVLNTVIQGYWMYCAGVIAVLSIAVVWYIRTPQGRHLWDTMKIKAPIVGPLFLKASLSRFTSIMGLLNQSGLPIIENLQITGKTIGNVIIAEAIDAIRESVYRGTGLAEPMKKNKLFTPLVIQMVAVGETSGKLDETLPKVAKFYDMEVENETKKLATYIEPLLTVVLGAVVLFFALAIFLPMWDMTKFARA